MRKFSEAKGLVLGLGLSLVGLGSQAAIFNSEMIESGQAWPDGIVYYNDYSNLSSERQSQITEAMDIWEDLTPIRFLPATSSNPYKVSFVDSGSCSSGVGKNTTVVRVHCNSGQWATYEIVHEIGHLVGLIHEQNRHDRDFYLDMDYNIYAVNGKSNWWQDGNVKIKPNTMDYGPYDEGSAMMYGMYNKDGDVVGGRTFSEVQAEPLTQGDIAVVNAMYESIVRSVGPWGNFSAINGEKLYFAGPTQSLVISDSNYSSSLPHLPPGAIVNYQLYKESSGWGPVNHQGQGVGMDGNETDFVAWLDYAPGYSIQYSIYSGGQWLPWQGDGRYASDNYQRNTIEGIRIRLKSDQKFISGTGYCLDVWQNLTHLQNTNVSAWHCTGKGEQQLILEAHEDIGIKTISQNVRETGLQIRSINDLCLAPANGNLSSGSSIQLESCCLPGENCTANPRNFWFIENTNQIKNYSNPSLCMTLDSDSATANLKLANCLVDDSAPGWGRQTFFSHDCTASWPNSCNN